LSLLGEADFHALVATHGRIYAHDATGSRFMVSTDHKQWQTRTRVTLNTFAVSPEAPDLVVGASEKGVMRSGDQGRRWSRPIGPVLAALVWNRTYELWGAGQDGQLYLSRDRGHTWASHGALGGEPEAILEQEGTLFVALNGRGVHRSDDGGRSWHLTHGPDGTPGR
jgi:photosystem II stability/assembly factor-like uncharacterized protein